MPRCAPCTTFAEVPPAPQLDRNWSSVTELIASARSGCDLCMLCWQYIYPQNGEYNNGPVRLYRKVHRFDSLTLDYAKSYSSRIFFADDRFRPPLVADGDTISQAQQLLEKCLSSHSKCSNVVIPGPDGSGDAGRDTADRSPVQRFLPRRLLDLSHGSDILVVDVEAWVVAGISSAAELSQYCTLSYRWGVTAQSCILEAPFASHISVDIEDMPQTFKDAIEISRRLKIRFLWIDALCIVQPVSHGDYTDWNAEGPRMGSIYHNAICTIAATCADSVTDGFLLKVDSGRIRAVPCRVMHHTKEEGIHSRFLSLRRTSLDYEITSSALNKRGWVTQERLLSRRVLHFTLEGVIWECQKLMEHGRSAVLNSIHLNHMFPSVRSLIFGKDDVKNAWTPFVVSYSLTEFTNAEDRLIALSSLARAVHRHLGHDDEYYAGIWKSQLIEGLLWIMWDPPSPESAQRLDIAPTWSWASLAGEITYITSYIDRKTFSSELVQLLDVYSVPAQLDNLYGNLKEGRITLLAQVLTFSLGTENVQFHKPEEEENEKYEMIMRFVYWDEWQQNLREEKQYRIIPLHVVDSWPGPGFAALIVEEVFSTDIVAIEDHCNRTFRRIGMLIDRLSKEAFDGLTAKGLRYNFGQAEQGMETVFLV